MEVQDIFFIQLFIVLILILFLSVAPAGYWKTYLALSSDKDSRFAIEKMKIESTQKEIEKIHGILLRKLHNDKMEQYHYIKEKINKSIDYAISRHDWYEDQRARVFQSTLTISSIFLAASTGILGISEFVDTSNFQPVAVTVAGIVLISLIITFSSLNEYNKQIDSDPPYRLVSDVRFWYFRYNLPDKGQTKQSQGNLVKLAESVLEERERFIARLVENFSLPKAIREDLEQIFILHVLQRYKSESLSRLRWILAYGYTFIGIQILFMAIVVACR